MPHTNNKGSSKRVKRKVLLELIAQIKSKIATKKAGPSSVKESRRSCWHLTLKTNGRGHAQITYLGTKYLAHRVMACVRRNGTVRRYRPYDQDKIQASHLCGDASCVNPKHLKFEPDLYNQTRDCCHRIGIGERKYRCPHQPKCAYLKPIKR